DLQSIKRRYSGTAFHQVEPWVGNREAPACRARRRAQQKSFLFRKVLPATKPSRELLSIVVQQQRIFQELFRKNSLRQAGQEDQLKRTCRGFRDRPHKDLTVAIVGRLDAQKRQSVGESLAHFRQGYRTHLAHWFQFSQYRQDGLRVAQSDRRQAAQHIQPLA